MPAEAEQNSIYEGELRGAQNADLSSVENRGIIKVFRDRNGHLVLDNTGNAVVILVPALVPDEEEAWEKCFQLFLRETHQVRGICLSRRKQTTSTSSPDVEY